MNTAATEPEVESRSLLPRVDLRRGMLWMLLSLTAFTCNALLIKHCSSNRHIDPWLTMSFRFVVGLVMTWVIFAPSGTLNVRRSFMNWLLASRGVLGAFGTAAYYASVGPLGAGKATLIGNTWTVWAAIIATVVLHERLGLEKFLGMVVAIGGLVLLTDITPESLAHDGKWELISLGGAILAALVIVVIRQLTTTESSATIFASQCVYGLLLAVPFAARHSDQLTLINFGFLTLAAVCAGVGQLAMTEGFRFLTVAAGGGFQMLVPLLISLGGILLFDERFALVQALGGVLILLGSFQTVAGWRWGSRGVRSR
jgi:S-adenosylmethionine uptake transporter